MTKRRPETGRLDTNRATNGLQEAGPSDKSKDETAQSYKELQYLEVIWGKHLKLLILT